MSAHALAPTPVGGPILTRTFKLLLTVVALGAIAALWRFTAGLGAASGLSDGYPWGIWIAIDVVTGTALGCGGFAVALLVYLLNRGRYHPLIRPAVLTSFLGYGLAVLAVVVDLGRFWELWKVPVFFWRWSKSPQLEVALCVAAYNAVLLAELSPALFERFRGGASPWLRRLSESGLRFMDRFGVWILALGLLLPSMHQSSLGTMMLLPGPRVHPLWFTPWLPLLFLVNCIGMGFAVVVLESTFSAAAFGRPRENAMLASLSRIAGWVTLGWLVFRLGEVVLAGDLGTAASRVGAFFVAEIVLHAAAAVCLLSPGLAARPTWQVRAAMLLLLGGALFRVNVYMIAFDPGPNWSYFPAVPELLITFGIVALEVALYLFLVKTFPILSGPAGHTGRTVEVPA